eukprot:gene7503-15354_t
MMTVVFILILFTRYTLAKQLIKNPRCIQFHNDFTIHIVVGGYKLDCDLKFLELLGLSNSIIYQYIREPVRNNTATNQIFECNMTVQKIFLSGNIGRDASALYDYLVRIYDSPPSYLIYLHGHIGNSWHTSPYAIYTRVRDYFLLVSTSKQSNIANRMITLTSHRSGGFKTNNWYGGAALEKTKPFEDISKNFIQIVTSSMYLEWSTTRECFEYIIYRIFQENSTTPEIDAWYRSKQISSNYEEEIEFSVAAAKAAEKCW